LCVSRGCGFIYAEHDSESTRELEREEDQAVERCRISSYSAAVCCDRFRTCDAYADSRRYAVFCCDRFRTCIERPVFYQCNHRVRNRARLWPIRRWYLGSSFPLTARAFAYLAFRAPPNLRLVSAMSCPDGDASLMAQREEEWLDALEINLNEKELPSFLAYRREKAPNFNGTPFYPNASHQRKAFQRDRAKSSCETHSYIFHAHMRALWRWLSRVRRQFWSETCHRTLHLPSAAEDFYRDVSADGCCSDVSWAPPMMGDHKILSNLMDVYRQWGVVEMLSPTVNAVEGSSDFAAVNAVEEDDREMESFERWGRGEQYAPSATLHDLYGPPSHETDYDSHGRVGRIAAELKACVWFRWALLQSDAILRERLQFCIATSKECICVDFLPMRCQCCGQVVWSDGADVAKVYRRLHCRHSSPTIRQICLLSYVLEKRAASLPVVPRYGLDVYASELRKAFDSGESAWLAAVREHRARLHRGDAAAFIEEVLALALSPVPLQRDIVTMADWGHFHAHKHHAIEKLLWCNLGCGPVHRDEFPHEMHLRLGICQQHGSRHKQKEIEEEYVCKACKQPRATTGDRTSSSVWCVVRRRSSRYARAKNSRARCAVRSSSKISAT
jgi:hypothetical protein